MFSHPDVLLDLARQHAAELIDEADQQRLAARVVRGRHRRAPDRRSARPRGQA